MGKPSLDEPRMTVSWRQSRAAPIAGLRRVMDAPEYAMRLPGHAC